MSVTKRVSGNYTISSVNAADQIFINTSTVTIDGNLVVLGNTINVDTVTVNLGDNIISLNTNLAATAAPTLNAGLQVNRGSSANVWMIWNETVKRWQITNDGSTYGNLATNLNTISNVYADPAPTLSANLNLNGHTLYSTTGSVQISASVAGSGGSGVYVTNTQTTGAELVTKAKAVAYSIVFG